MSAKQILDEIRRCNDKNYMPSITRFRLGRIAFRKGVVPPKKCHSDILAGWRSVSQ